MVNGYDKEGGWGLESNNKYSLGNYKDGFKIKRWRRFDNIYKRNAIFTKVNPRYSAQKESQECPWYEEV